MALSSELRPDSTAAGGRTGFVSWVVGVCMLAAAACGSDTGGGGKDSGGLDGVSDGAQIPDGGLAELPEVYATDVGVTPPKNRFVYAEGCRLAEDPGGQGTIKLARAYPNLNFSKAVQLAIPGDGTGRRFVVEQDGRILVFNHVENTTETKEFLDATGLTSGFGEQGLLGMAFHPDFKSNGHFYVNYTSKTTKDTVIARFRVSDDDKDKADPDSHTVLLTVEQPYANHNGGQILFGPDGYLYIGMGDGGSGGDPKGHGQNTKTLLGAMLRIDVDRPSGGALYGIPADNPFANATDGSRPEIFAWGLRNPWRFSFDRLTGTLWAGDVGQEKIEEVDIVELGKNYGWNTMEGTACYDPPVGCNKQGLVLPVAEYTHADVGKSITGGYVYRGSAIPTLYGSYVYGDFVTAQILIWKVGEGPPPTLGSLKAPGSIAAFGEDEAGELYVVTYQNGLYRFVETDPKPPAANFPRLLSETGCFEDLQELRPKAGVLPYSIQSPLWSDGARKSRFVVLPKDGVIQLDNDKARLVYPAGTTFVKHFELAMDKGDPNSAVRLETRFLVVTEKGVNGYTYRWNDEGTDAELLPGADVRAFNLSDEEGNEMAYTWQFPSRTQCDACHTAASGYVLGADDVGQMNRFGDAESTKTLVNWAGWGILDTPEGLDWEQLPRFANPYDLTADVGLRVRSYLHSNCAGCHQPGASLGTELDLRFETPLFAMGMCGMEPLKGDLGWAGATLLTPGEPDNSILVLRMAHQGAYRMPPLASSVVDEQAVRMVRQWVVALPGCVETQ